MANIVIKIDLEALNSGVNQSVDDDYGEFACPLVTHDPESNADHKQYAINEFDYGQSKGDEKCGVCTFYNIKSEMMDCIEQGMEESFGLGYCTKLDFVCAADHWCKAFSEGGPMTDFEDMDDLEPIEGGSKDIF